MLPVPSVGSGTGQLAAEGRTGGVTREEAGITGWLLAHQSSGIATHVQRIANVGWIKPGECWGNTLFLACRAGGRNT